MQSDSARKAHRAVPTAGRHLGGFVTTRLETSWRVRQLPSSGPLSPDQAESLSSAGTLDEDWLSAAMPAQVHEILLAHGRIEDPALPGNAARIAWVAESDWLYRVTFARPRSGLRHYLHFEGLDTFVDVYLNGHHLAFHDDCFLPLRIDVTGQLVDENVLLLHFHAPKRHIEERSKDGPGGMVPDYHHVRKPSPDFGSFLGAPPGLVKIGVFGEIHLEGAGAMEIEHAGHETSLSPPYERATVGLSAEGRGFETEARVEFVLVGPDGKELWREAVDAEAVGDGRWQARARVTVEAPELWWPRGHGEQPLYRASFRLAGASGILDEVSKTLGFRDLRMERPLDFSVNGRKIKLYGANLGGPLHGLSYRWDSERFENLLLLAENAWVNTLRLWGAAPPCHEDLFEEADRRGLLIWHDFYHDAGGYPEDEDFRAACRREAEYLIRRRKHHPSLLLWCGGNEVHQACQTPGPDQPVPGRPIFEEDYPSLCRTLDPTRPYLVNSPYASTWANDPSLADMHDWTRHFFVPGEAYPVFYSELCRVSAPHVKTLRRIIPDEEEFWPEGFSGQIKNPLDSGVPPAWHHFIEESFSPYYYGGPIGDFYDVDSAEGLVYRYGAADEVYIRSNIERYRRGRPASDPHGERRSRGTLLWKLNDTFPQFYAAAIDFFGEPTMKYYAMRRAFEPVLVSIDVGDHITVWVVNDSPLEIMGELVIRLFDPFVNIAVKEIRRPVRVRSDHSEVVISLDEWGMISRAQLIVAELIDASGARITRALQAVEVERRRTFPEAVLALRERDGLLEIGTDRYARSVELAGEAEGDAFGWHFEDNYFDLLPGEIKRVRLLGRHRCGTVSGKAYYSPHVTSISIGAASP